MPLPSIALLPLVPCWQSDFFNGGKSPIILNHHHVVLALQRKKKSLSRESLIRYILKNNAANIHQPPQFDFAFPYEVVGDKCANNPTQKGLMIVSPSISSWSDGTSELGGHPITTYQSDRTKGFDLTHNTLKAETQGFWLWPTHNDEKISTRWMKTDDVTESS